MKVRTKKNVMLNGKFTEKNTILDIDNVLALQLKENGSIEIIEEPKKEEKKPRKEVEE